MKKKVINESLNKDIVYKDKNNLIYTELCRQAYSNNKCIFSAGFVEGDNKPDEDILYLKLEKDNVEPIILLVRPDEAQSLSWVMLGAVWSYLMEIKKK